MKIFNDLRLKTAAEDRSRWHERDSHGAGHEPLLQGAEGPIFCFQSFFFVGFLKNPAWPGPIPYFHAGREEHLLQEAAMNKMKGMARDGALDKLEARSSIPELPDDFTYGCTRPADPASKV